MAISNRLLSRFIYGSRKFQYSVFATVRKRQIGALSLSPRVVYTEFKKNFLFERMSLIHGYEGDAMAPTIGVERQVLLVRKLPFPDYMFSATFSVGDVIVLKDPENSEKGLVRRIVAVGGDEMISTDDKDEAFVLEDNNCWVLSDNEAKTIKEAKDSRSFGPVPARNIIGRVIYRFRNSEDHGSVKNSNDVDIGDEILLQWELNVDEMAKKASEGGEQDYH